MATAIKIDVRKYVLKDERKLPADKQTSFLFKPLGGLDYCEVQDLTKFDKESMMQLVEQGKKDGKKKDKDNFFAVPTNATRLQYETILRSLVGWENFKYADGSKCVFDEDDPAANMLKISTDDWIELYLAIRETNEVDGATAKNSN